MALQAASLRACDPVDPVDEAKVVARVTRYSSLRGVERALLPSVRRRIRLPTTRLGTAILTRLQALLEGVRANPQPDAEADAHVRRELDRLDATLAEFAAALTAMIDETPIAQLRATLPPLLDRSRGEVGALLDLWLETHAPGPGSGPPIKIDFLITLLARQRQGEVATLGRDPCTVTPGVRRLCEAREADPDERAPALARRFRDARIDLLATEDLDAIIRRMREAKAELGACLFDRDVLRAVVCYNLAAQNRFQDLFRLEHCKDAAIERTLHALSHLDRAGAPGDADPIGADADDPDSAGVRALEEALRTRLATPDPGGARSAAPTPAERATDPLQRAAVLVGLAMRELPSLLARLRELDVDPSAVETDWVRELDRALLAAIQTLSRSGRSEQAADLARTRMRYLSGH